MEYLERMLEAECAHLDRESFKKYVTKKELLDNIYKLDKGEYHTKSKLNAMKKEDLCKLYADMKGYKLIDDKVMYHPGNEPYLFHGKKTAKQKERERRIKAANRPLHA